MVYLQYITSLLLATIVMADYYVDNANTSIIYSMAPSQSGQGWQIFSVSSQSLELRFSNSTGNHTMLLDASHCYDQNYALGVCGINDNCQVQIPFRGSGITMYVFNAGLSGMTASFSVDGGDAVSNSIDAPPPPTYQVSNVSLYNIQGLTAGNHVMLMTMLDWNGSPTSMKFDYAYINETSAELPATTSSTSFVRSTTSQASLQTPSQTSPGNPSTSNKSNIGAIIGGVVGGLIGLTVVAIGCFYLRKRKHRAQSSPESTFQVNPFAPEYPHSPAPPSVSPLVRSAILRGALAAAAGTQPPPESIQNPQSIGSGMNSPVLQPLRRQRSSIADTNPHASPSSTSGVAGLEVSPLCPQCTLAHNLTAAQREAVNWLRASNVPTDAIARVIEGYIDSGIPAGEGSSTKVTCGESILSALPPPSYQTRDR